MSFWAITNIDEQVKKAIQELDMRYSRGMEFKIDDLMAVSSCKEASNYKTFFAKAEAKIASSGKVAPTRTINKVSYYKVK